MQVEPTVEANRVLNHFVGDALIFPDRSKAIKYKKKTGKQINLVRWSLCRVRVLIRSSVSTATRVQCSVKLTHGRSDFARSTSRIVVLFHASRPTGLVSFSNTYKSLRTVLNLAYMHCMYCLDLLGFITADEYCFQHITRALYT